MIYILAAYLLLSTGETRRVVVEHVDYQWCTAEAAYLNEMTIAPMRYVCEVEL